VTDDFAADSSAAFAAGAAAKAATTRKNQGRKRAEAVLRRLSRQIKVRRGYTASVGVGLGIVARSLLRVKLSAGAPCSCLRLGGIE
jgi:hypothetical protein